MNIDKAYVNKALWLTLAAEADPLKASPRGAPLQDAVVRPLCFPTLPPTGLDLGQDPTTLRRDLQAVALAFGARAERLAGDVKASAATNIQRISWEMQRLRQDHLSQEWTGGCSELEGLSRVDWKSPCPPQLKAFLGASVYLTMLRTGEFASADHFADKAGPEYGVALIDPTLLDAATSAGVTALRSRAETNTIDLDSLRRLVPQRLSAEAYAQTVLTAAANGVQVVEKDSIFPDLLTGVDPALVDRAQRGYAVKVLEAIAAGTPLNHPSGAARKDTLEWLRRELKHLATSDATVVPRDTLRTTLAMGLMSYWNNGQRELEASQCATMLHLLLTNNEPTPADLEAAASRIQLSAIASDEVLDLLKARLPQEEFRGHVVSILRYVIHEGVLGAGKRVGEIIERYDQERSINVTALCKELRVNGVDIAAPLVARTADASPATKTLVDLFLRLRGGVDVDKPAAFLSTLSDHLVTSGQFDRQASAMAMITVLEIINGVAPKTRPATT